MRIASRRDRFLPPFSGFFWQNGRAIRFSEKSGFQRLVKPHVSGGMTYLRMGKAGEAEKAFRADLEKNRRNPRSLFGLSESLKAQGNAYAAQLVELEFQAVWRNAEGPMRPVEEW